MASDTLRTGLIKGYRLYITNRRIVGVKDRKAALASAFLDELPTSLVSIMLVAGVETVKEVREARKTMERKLEELERKKKDFEVYWDDIVSIEMKKPGSIRGGYMKIHRLTGKEIKIDSFGKEECEKILEAL